MPTELQRALLLWGGALRRRRLSLGRLLALISVAAASEQPLPRLQQRLPRLLRRAVPHANRRTACMEAARLLKQQRSPALALAALQPLLERSIDPELALLLGELLRLCGDQAEAEAHLRQALLHPAQQAAAAYQLGELERSRGGFDQAARWLLRSLEADPLNRYSHNALHYTRFSRELLPEVVAAYQSLASAHPHNGLVHHLLSHYLLRHGESAAAAGLAQQAARLELGSRQNSLAPPDAAPLPPDFLIIGVPKGGTSSLLAWLGGHPQLWVHPRKEIHFFDIGWHHGSPWYCSQFPRFVQGSGILRGEATPNYFQLPEVPVRVKAVMPQARLILLLRDPLERALSWMAHLQRHEGLHGEPSALLHDELERLQALPVDALCHSGFRWPNALLGSCYDAPLRRWQACFPPEQLLVLRSEALFGQPHATLRRVARFLGVNEEWPIGELTAYNQAPATGVAVASEDRARLKTFLDHNNRLIASI